MRDLLTYLVYSEKISQDILSIFWLKKVDLVGLGVRTVRETKEVHGLLAELKHERHVSSHRNHKLDAIMLEVSLLDLFNAAYDAIAGEVVLWGTDEMITYHHPAGKIILGAEKWKEAMATYNMLRASKLL